MMTADWKRDNSRKIPVYRLTLPDHVGELVVQKASTWIWVGVYDNNNIYATGRGHKSPEEAKEVALGWLSGVLLRKEMTNGQADRIPN